MHRASKVLERAEVPGEVGPQPQGPEFQRSLAQSEVIRAYRVAEFATLARDGSPVCWPLAPALEHGRLIFSTGYAYPTKARNAQRNPRVAAHFSDPTASGRSEDDPLVLVQGLAEVFDRNLQQNTDRYVDQLLQKAPATFRFMLRTPGVRQLLVGYVARIWIEMVPRQEYTWARTERIPEPLRFASHPPSCSPGPQIELPEDVFRWIHHYSRPPVLAYIDRAGWPAITRVRAVIKPDHIQVETDLVSAPGAPACLTYHRLVGNYWANDTFLIRGHFDSAGRLLPEKIVGFAGSRDDRGLGSLKFVRMLWDLRRKLSIQLQKEGRPLPVVRSTPKT